MVDFLYSGEYNDYKSIDFLWMRETEREELL